MRASALSGKGEAATESQETQQPQTGEPASFEDDYPRIRRYIQSMVRDPAEADDLTQETFLRAHRHKDSLREGEARQAWLYRIATNVCVDRLRQRTRRMQVVSADGPSENLVNPDAPSVEEVAERREMSSCVQLYVQDLPDTYRSALMLNYEHGLTAAEIAGTLGISLGAAKIRLHRARQLLQAAMQAGCAFSHDNRNVLVCESRDPRESVSFSTPHSSMEAEGLNSVPPAETTDREGRP